MTDVVVKKYYVYHAYSKCGELLYVGKGTGDRYKHCLSGASNNKDINRYYFMNGEDGSIEVRIVRYFDNSEDALHSESCDIDTLKPAFNVVGNKNFEEQDIEEVKRKLEIVEKEVKDARKVKLYAIYTSKKYLKIAEMACEIGVSVRTVKYWLKELRNTGFIE